MTGAEHDPIEDLLAAVLDRPDAEWERALDEACALHAEHADALRERFRRLDGGDLGWEREVAAIPERLGRYRLVERIGGGGMGVVYRALDGDLGREVALKLVRPELLFFPGARERFRREVAASAALQHQGIVPVHEFGEIDGIPFFAMELVAGLSLADVIDRLRGRDPASLSGADVAALLRPLGEPAPKLATWSWSELCAGVILQAARAVDHAHARGVVHRDLKPGNLMLTPDGRVRVLDFGISLREGTTRLTMSGAPIGSLLYTAPEQIRNGVCDRRVDVYGLGVTLYELLAQRAPFFDRDPERARQRILAGRCEPLSRLQRAVPRDLETVCLKAMDLDPERRYATARAFADDLQHVLEKLPVAARRPSAALRTRRFARRHPTLTAAAALAAVLALAAPTMLWLQSRIYVADLERLSDELVVDDLVAEDERLWPAAPANAAAMQRWLDRAEGVLARRPIHERTLADLRVTALPRAAQDEVRDGERRAELLKDQEAARTKADDLRSGGADRASSRELARYEDELLELTTEIEDRASWRDWQFDHTAGAWQHARLAGLLAKLRLLPERRDRMQQRLEYARSVEPRTIDAQRDAWARTIAAVAGDARYAGLALTPQRGLVPLGPDPDSGLLEFAHLQSGSPAVRDPETGRLHRGVETGLVLALVPAGRFTMGARPPAPEGGPGDPMALPPEAPPHEVALDAFFLAKHEMTQAQWFRAAGDNPAEVMPGESPTGERITLQHPVENVSWLECERVLRQLDLELPTEAQWEYAARGGTTTPWWTGGDPASVEGAANVRDQTLQELAGFANCAPFRDGCIAHAPVGSFRPNRFGLHDVIGNVSEWVRDTFADYDQPGRAGDGLRSDPTQTNAVYRGGAYMDPLNISRSSFRKKEERGNRWSYVGVRPGRRVEQ